MLWLKVELLSSVLVGSGVGAPGLADRDVVTGRTGVPHIPGKRLKGLLSDAYELLRDAEGAGGWGLPTVLELFPKGGAEIPGPLEIRTARLPGAEELERWIAAVLRSQTTGDPIEEKLQPDEVTALYTELRHQTAISMETGAAQKDTLRISRVLRSGRCFYAPVKVREGAPSGALRALALAAAAVQRMGGSRSRGFGKVSCALLEGTKPGDAANKNLTELALARSGWVEATPTVTKAFAETADGGTTACVLRYRLHLRQPALVPRLGNDPNLVATEHYLPGAAVLGALARQYLASHAPDGRFYELFCGPVKFLAAYNSTGSRNRCVPVPHSLRKYKRRDGYVDLAVEERDADEGITRIRGAWCEAQLLWSGDSQKVQTETRFEYHQARARDRRIQRSVKSGAEEGSAAYDGLADSERGAFFAYESIAPDQDFSGALIGAEQDLVQLRELIAENDEVNVGRSRNSQYGGAAAWHWVDDTPIPLNQTGDEISNWDAKSGASARGDQLVVTLLSPMLTMNEDGHPVAGFAGHALAASLTWPEGSMDQPEASYTRQGWVAGYLAHQGLPRQQVPVLEAGSVFVFRLPDGCSPVEEPRRNAAALSYGLRTEQGFGRVSLEWWTKGESRGFGNREIFERAPFRALKKLAVDSAARELALGLLRGRVHDLAVRRGSLLRGELKVPANASPVKSSLLHRLLAWLEAEDPEIFANQVRQLRETASNQLNRVHIHPEGENLQKLGAWLVKTGAGWRAVFADLAQKTYLSHPGWGASLGQNPLLGQTRAGGGGATEPVDAEFAKSVVCSMLRACLSAMAVDRREIR